MKDERTFTGRLHENQGTLCALVTGPVPPAPLPPRAAFLAAHDRMRHLAEAAGEPSVVVAAVDPRGRVVDACFVPDRASLVVGRHTECGLRLAGGAVSLRHVALLARRAAERMNVHLWDLNTEQPFRTEDAETASALVSDGPVYFAVAEYALWAVPSASLSALPERAKDAWDALPPRDFLDRRVPEAPPPARRWPSSAPEPEAGPVVTELTTVTMRAPPLLLHEDDEPEVGWGVLRLATRGRKARHLVSAERLERGVLLGRYDRCGLTIGGLDAISRVHLLVVRISDEVWAIDTASTNGVRRRGQPVTAILLADEDELELARSLSVTWTRELHPEA